ncbi:MAG: crossover junction endodeoxyribonuclease RuvC [Candidatus Binatia bacterium]|nr:MAG: crossover junction endodeoxyribonuclease RuvC [Candidatus Binatia bacterium]
MAEGRFRGRVPRILGVDPGTVRTGWGVVEKGPRGLSCVAGGAIELRGSRSERLGRICRELVDIARRYRPTAVSLEKAFAAANLQAALRLGEARGAVLAAAALAGLEVFEYSPAEIKLAVVGYGRAEKQQVQAMTRHLLALPCPPGPDEADALASAICHLHVADVRERVGGSFSVARKGGGRRA